MRKYLLFAPILFLSLIPKLSIAQHKYLDTTVVWSGLMINSYDSLHYETFKIHLHGDTVVNGKHYYKSMKTSKDSVISSMPPINYHIHHIHQEVGLIREDPNKKQFLAPSGTTETVVFDFNHKIGDTLCYKNFIIVDMDTVYIGTEPRQRFIIDKYNYLIEGVGYSGGGGTLDKFSPPCGVIMEYGNWLYDFTKGQNTIYLNPVNVSVKIKPHHLSCNNQSNGGADAQAAWGYPPYRYVWSNNATTASISGLSTGTYSVTVTDSYSNTARASTTISTIPTPSIALTTQNSACLGANNGCVFSTATGGSAPYSYIWSNGATTARISGLSAGTYTVTLSDATACHATASATISTLPTLTVTLMVQGIHCGPDDGSMMTHLTGGTAPYNYIWNNGATTAGINGLSTGTYSVTTSDANGCSATASATITATPLLAVTTTTQDITCYGNNDGSMMTHLTGGTPPYSYLWNNGATTAGILGLNAGEYTVTISDANGCSTLTSVNVTTPAPLQATTTTTLSTGNNGSASVTATGGTVPYTYLWSNGTTIASVSGLTAGTYYVTVQDKNGCTVKDMAVVESNVGIAKLNAMKDLKLWPNPVTGGILHIDYAGHFEHIDIYNELGQSVLQSQPVKMLDVSGLAKGMYTVIFSDTQSKTICKVLIQ